MESLLKAYQESLDRAASEMTSDSPQMVFNPATPCGSDYQYKYAAQGVTSQDLHDMFAISLAARTNEPPVKRIKCRNCRCPALSSNPQTMFCAKDCETSYSVRQTLVQYSLLQQETQKRKKAQLFGLTPESDNEDEGFVFVDSVEEENGKHKRASQQQQKSATPSIPILKMKV